MRYGALHQSDPYSVMQLCFPYGKYICADGTEVFFNRHYQPIWRRASGGKFHPADPAERIKFVDQEWLWDDHNPPWSNRKTHELCLKMLQERHGYGED